MNVTVEEMQAKLTKCQRAEAMWRERWVRWHRIAQRTYWGGDAQAAKDAKEVLLLAILATEEAAAAVKLLERHLADEWNKNVKNGGYRGQ